jgi:purine-binding chemotaxis protein CheW
MGQNSSETDSASTPHNFDEASGRYLTFWTDNQLFGISIASVEQIVKMQKITSFPEFPDYAKGIIDLRGNIIPIIDVRLRLHKQEIPYNDRTCIIVTNIHQNLIGLIVDAVDEVTKLDEESISAPPKVSTDNTNVYLTGIAKSDGKIILLLDSEKILENDELAEIIQDNV